MGVLSKFRRVSDEHPATQQPEEVPVFVAQKAQPTLPPREFAPMEFQASDDELVYRVRTHPALCLTRELGGRRSLLFESLLAGSYAELLLDSGASHSFVSSQYLAESGITFEHVDFPDASLADGSCVRVLGITKRLELKIGSFRCKQQYLVVDMDAYDCVLGMSFLYDFNPHIDWRRRTMSLPYRGSSVCVHAFSREELPNLNSTKFELCTIQSLSRRSLSRAAREGAVLASVIPVLSAITADELEDPVLSGPGATHPSVKPILEQYQQIPGGLPPERFASDGSPIEHCIDLADGEKPYARPPRPFTPQEDEQIQKHLTDLLAKGWITPSLSPWAAPVLFVPKKRPRNG